MIDLNTNQQIHLIHSAEMVAEIVELTSDYEFLSIDKTKLPEIIKESMEIFWDYVCEFIQLNFEPNLYQKIVQAKNQNNFGEIIKDVRAMAVLGMAFENFKQTMINFHTN